MMEFTFKNKDSQVKLNASINIDSGEEYVEYELSAIDDLDDSVWLCPMIQTMYVDGIPYPMEADNNLKWFKSNWRNYLDPIFLEEEERN